MDVAYGYTPAIRQKYTASKKKLHFLAFLKK